MTLALAWNPRWAVIIFVNSSARSTFDCSMAPALSVEDSPGCDEDLRARVRGKRVGVVAGTHETARIGELRKHDLTKRLQCTVAERTADIALSHRTPHPAACRMQ